MRQAVLVLFGVASLRGQTVGDPDVRLGAGEKVRNHRFAAAGRDDVGDRGGAAKDPLPVGFSLDARRGLVAVDHRRRAHGGSNGCGCGRERLGGAGDHIGDGALGDGQPKEVARRLDEAAIADHLARVQINDQRCNAGPERSAGRHIGRRRRRDARPATPTGAAVEIDPCRDRLDWRQINVIVGPDERLIRWHGLGAATRATLGKDIAHLIGSGQSCRATPGRPLRLSLRRSARLAFWPRDGGSDELSGVLGGWPNFASSAATLASSASTSMISSDLSSRLSDDASIQSLNQTHSLRSTPNPRVKPTHGG